MGVRERKREKARKQKVQQQKISKAGNQKATPAQGAASPSSSSRKFRFSNNALLLGEGDFSFSAACVQLQGGRLLRDQSLVVSAYDSKVQ